MSEQRAGAEPRFPRPRVKNSLDFSFSGLKTALVRRAEEKGIYPPREGAEIDQQEVANVAGAFQEAMVDTMVRRTVEVAEQYRVNGVLLGGGVSANTLLRERMRERSPVEVLVPRPELCTDNAAMVGAAAFFGSDAAQGRQWDLDVVPSLRLG